jgi:hypothetical protein
MMQKKTLLLNFLIVFGILMTVNFVEGQKVPEIIDSISKLGTDEIKTEQILETDQIAKGSEIIEAKITVTMNAKEHSTCFLKLLESDLNEIQISDSFQCEGTNVISLNELGKDALESKLIKDTLQIGVVFTDKQDEKTDYKIINYDIKYKKPTYFAEIVDNKVISVIVAYQSYIDTISGKWIETKIDGSLRGTYAGIGFDYDSIKDEFTNPNLIIDEVIIINNGT